MARLWAYLLVLIFMIASANAEEVHISTRFDRIPLPVSVYNQAEASAGHGKRFGKWLVNSESLESIPIYTYRPEDICGPIPNPNASSFRKWWATKVMDVGFVTLLANTDVPLGALIPSTMKLGNLPLELLEYTQVSDQVSDQLALKKLEWEKELNNLPLELAEYTQVSDQLVLEELEWEKELKEKYNVKGLSAKTPLGNWLWYLPEDKDIDKDVPMSSSVNISEDLTLVDMLNAWKGTVSVPEYVGVSFGASYIENGEHKRYTRGMLCERIETWAEVYKGYVAGLFAQKVKDKANNYLVGIQYPFVDYDTRDPFWVKIEPLWAEVQTSGHGVE